MAPKPRRHDDPAPGGAKRGQHVIVVARIVRPAVHEEDGIAGRIAALLVGDVEACGADVLDGGAHDAMVWQLDRQGCALPENGVGCVSTDRPSIESSHIYKRSTPVSNFEIASSQARACARRGCPCRRATTARAEPTNDRENKIGLPCGDRTCWCVRHCCRHRRNCRWLNGNYLGILAHSIPPATSTINTGASYNLGGLSILTMRKSGAALGILFMACEVLGRL